VVPERCGCGPGLSLVTRGTGFAGFPPAPTWGLTTTGPLVAGDVGEVARPTSRLDTSPPNEVTRKLPVLVAGSSTDLSAHLTGGAQGVSCSSPGRARKRTLTVAVSQTVECATIRWQAAASHLTC
jgi:hypothetical protein